MMSQWYDNQNKPSCNFLKLFKERIDKANPLRQLTAAETKRLAKLENNNLPFVNKTETGLGFLRSKTVLPVNLASMNELYILTTKAGKWHGKTVLNAHLTHT